MDGDVDFVDLAQFNNAMNSPSLQMPPSVAPAHGWFLVSFIYTHSLRSLTNVENHALLIHRRLNESLAALRPAPAEGPALGRSASRGVGSGRDERPAVGEAGRVRSVRRSEPSAPIRDARRYRGCG